MKRKRLLSLLMAVTLLAAYLCTNASALTSSNYRFGQTEARKMLSMINTFRKPGNAWHWDQSNSQKIEPTNLKDLVYDYGLEAIAMQRAAEIAVQFSRTRPDGTDYLTAYDGVSVFHSEGENIAMGTGGAMATAQAAFEAWCETNEKYAGQGHRRNMLRDDVTGIGIGHVVYNGAHYWVQEFGSPLSGAAYTDPLDGEKTVTIRHSSDPQGTKPVDPTPITPDRPAVDYSVGDVDGNGTIEPADARLALRASVQLEQYPVNSVQFFAADVNKNGMIEPSDARSIPRAAVGLEQLKDSSSFGGKAALNILPDSITLSQGGIAVIPVEVTWAVGFDTLINDSTNNAIGMKWAGEKRAEDGSTLVFLCATALADSGSGTISVRMDGLPEVNDAVTVDISEIIPEGIVGYEGIPDFGAHWRVSPEDVFVASSNQFFLVYRASDIAAQTGFRTNKEVLEDCLTYIEEKEFIYRESVREDNPNGDGYTDYFYFYNTETDCELCLGVYFINGVVYQYFLAWTI